MGLGDLVQKAVYLGIGVASYAGEKAGEKLGELRGQMQKMADEMVERGEMSAEEARRFVDETMAKAQQPAADPTPAKPSEPRRIEIITDEEEPTQSPDQTEEMRRKVVELQEELRRLQNKS